MRKVGIMKPTSTSILLGLLFPYIVAFTPSPNDTSSTTVEVALGQGSYADVSRDCSGRVRSVRDVPFSELGGRVTHQVSWFRFGLSAGYSSNWRQTVFDQYVALHNEDLIYVAPQLGVNTQWFGLDAGYLFPLNSSADIGFPGYYYSQTEFTGSPAAMLRLGNRDAWFLSASIANNLPLSAGGGLVDVGLGFCGGKPHSLYWFGVAGSPYDGIAFSFKGDIPVSTNFVLSTRTQIAYRDVFEYGLALGGKIIF